jgi:hypothetical protein
MLSTADDEKVAYPTPNRPRPGSAAIKANLIPPLQRQQLAGNLRNSCHECHVTWENECARAIVYAAVKNCARSPQQTTQRAKELDRNRTQSTFSGINQRTLLSRWSNYMGALLVDTCNNPGKRLVMVLF